MRQRRDELVIESLSDVLRNCGCSADVICVLTARHGGKKWNDLPKYLTGLTEAQRDRRRVEAARASIGRQKDKLRASAWAESEWKPRLNRATSYKERLPKGAPWNGLSTFTHSLKGVNIEIEREVMSAERKKLFVTK